MWAFVLTNTALRYQSDILLIQLRDPPEAHSKTGVLKTGNRNKGYFELLPMFSSHIGGMERSFAQYYQSLLLLLADHHLRTF
jgi:hypothetical protein